MLNRKHQAGTSMMEVLVSIVIVVIGLLGLGALQSHATLAEMESFQRAQAITLLQDMVDRLNANRLAMQSYPTSGALGTGNSSADCGALSGQARDHCEWNNALLGAAETAGTNKVGAMIGARGCITETVATMPREYEIAVVWQGLTATKAPSTACGAGSYGDDKTRRAVTARVKIACLQNNTTTGVCAFPP